MGRTVQEVHIPFVRRGNKGEGKIGYVTLIYEDGIGILVSKGSGVGRWLVSWGQDHENEAPALCCCGCTIEQKYIPYLLRFLPQFGIRKLLVRNAAELSELNLNCEINPVEAGGEQGLALVEGWLKITDTRPGDKFK